MEIVRINCAGGDRPGDGEKKGSGSFLKKRTKKLLL
jgi:hypothetical protein